jgi:copper homeostasis protein
VKVVEKDIVIEVCIDSVQSAIAAEKGGANRVELCDNLISGGTTPSAASIELARKSIDIDINVIIRPRGGDFCYSQLEFEIMKRDIEIVKNMGVNGVVVGILKPNGEVDKERMKEIIEIARPLSVTFHRAFDMTKDPFKALDTLIELKVDRILTSGQKNKTIEGIDLIKELVNKAQDKIIIMPGSGINKDNIKNIVSQTGVKEFHLSAKKKVDSVMEYRNQAVSMGGILQPSEYENYFADEKAIREIRNLYKIRGN